MSADLSISELDKIFAGSRSGQLTEHEIYLLVSTETTSAIRYYLYQALLKKAIDPRILLKSIIDKILTDRPLCYDPSTKDKLGIFGLTLRGMHRANPNTYIRRKNNGTMHIIGYIFSGEIVNKSVKDVETYMMMLLILVFSGSNMSLQIYSEDAEEYLEDKQNLFEVKKGTTVREYLLSRNQGDLVKKLDSFKDDVDKYIAGKRMDPGFKLKSSAVNDDVLRSLGMYLDYPSLIIGNYVNEFDFIKFQDLRILESNRLVLKIHDLKSLLRYSILLNSPDIFRIVFKKLGTIDYIDINMLLIDTALNKRYKYLQDELKECIRFIIGTGATLDAYEVTLLQNIGSEFTEEILKLYNQPRHLKECSLLEGEPTAELRELAYQLNINPFNNKNFICAKIKDISDADPTQLVKAAVNREKEKLSSKYSSITDYIDGEPSYQCHNKELLSKDPFEYVDLDIASYKDTRGLIWCFTKESFDVLLKTKRNIYDSEVLPDTFIDSLIEQKKILERLGVYKNKSKLISDGINELNEKEEVKSKNQMDQIVKKFEDILLKANINPTYVRNLSGANMTILSRPFEKPEINFGVFSDPQQRYIAFAVTMFTKFQEKPNDIRIFVDKYHNLIV